MMHDIVVLAMSMVAQGAAFGSFPKPSSETTTAPYNGVALIERKYEVPRPLRVWIVRIDLAAANIDFDFTAPAKGLAGFETTSSTTIGFAKEKKVELAINASAFAPIRLLQGEGVRINGLGATNGTVYSAPDPSYDALTLSVDRIARIVPGSAQSTALPSVRDAVAGFKIVLRDGLNQFGPEAKPLARPVLHPRTAVGLTHDRMTMFWFVIDGRQPKVSEGVSLRELAELAASVGATDALNLDGGGSTTLVVRDPKSRDWRVVNTPVGVKNIPRSLRQNGNAIGVQIYGLDGDLTHEQLAAIAPTMTPARLRRFLGPLNRAMDEAAIDTPLRRSAFLAQLVHESDEFRQMEESTGGSADEGLASLGNTQPGDGRRFKGRGPILLRGRANYRTAGEALGIPLEARPDLAARPDIGCRIAAWRWSTHQLNERADHRDFRAITLKLIGSSIGQAEREKYYDRALKALGVDAGILRPQVLSR